MRAGIRQPVEDEKFARPNHHWHLVAAALAAGAIEAGKAALGAAAKDAYDKLKALAARALGPSVAQLEAKPESQNRVGTELDVHGSASGGGLRRSSRALAS